MDIKSFEELLTKRNQLLRGGLYLTANPKDFIRLIKEDLALAEKYRSQEFDKNANICQSLVKSAHEQEFYILTEIAELLNATEDKETKQKISGILHTFLLKLKQDNINDELNFQKNPKNICHLLVNEKEKEYDNLNLLMEKSSPSVMLERIVYKKTDSKTVFDTLVNDLKGPYDSDAKNIIKKLTDALRTVQAPEFKEKIVASFSKDVLQTLFSKNENLAKHLYNASENFMIKRQPEFVLKIRPNAMYEFSNQAYKLFNENNALKKQIAELKGQQLVQRQNRGATPTENTLLHDKNKARPDSEVNNNNNPNKKQKQ